MEFRNLANNPTHSILAATHNVEFAERWGRRVRNDISDNAPVLGIKLAEDSNAAFLTGRAIDYLEARRGRPWFVHLSYWHPHPPFIVPEPYNDRYDPADPEHVRVLCETKPLVGLLRALHWDDYQRAFDRSETKKRRQEPDW